MLPSEADLQLETSAQLLDPTHSEHSAKAAARCERALRSFFETTPEGWVKPIRQFSDKDFENIKVVLANTGGNGWDTVPRTFTVLHLIGKLKHVSTFLRAGCNDLQIPYTLTRDTYARDNFPTDLPISVKEKFFKAQDLLLTERMDLERGVTGKHLHLSSASELFEISKWLCG